MDSVEKALKKKNVWTIGLKLNAKRRWNKTNVNVTRWPQIVFSLVVIVMISKVGMNKLHISISGLKYSLKSLTNLISLY